MKPLAWLALAAVPVQGFATEGARTPFIAPPAPPGLHAAWPGSIAEEANLPEPLPKEKMAHRPYSMLGRLTFRSGGTPYIGSATLVRPKVALTAAHNLWDPREGWSTGVTFERAKHGRSGSSTRARGLYLYSNRYQAKASANPESSAAFAWDVGWITLPRRLVRGRTADAVASPAALRGGAQKQALGYGMDFHAGHAPLVVEAGAFQRRRGQYFESRTYGTEGGMSGGPLLANIAGRWVLVGVLVSGYYDYSGSGVRAVDAGLLGALRRSR